MCGIAGVFNIKESEPVCFKKLNNMAAILKHRGPDEFGIYIDNSIGLASSRLKVIDLLGGTQPIHNEDNSLWIILNGEIFNYIELREELIKKHKFYTTTDTEVVLHLYEEKGIGFLNELNGEFAVSIYNSKTNELLLARDRFGIRPLYYTFYKNQFIFASEIKSIFAACNMPRLIDPIALDQIFTFWTTLPGKSVFKDIHEVLPACYLKVSPGGIQSGSYWTLPFLPTEEHYKAGCDNFTSQIYELLLDAVRIRLRSDVPVGCYISGGLDSSGIASIIKNNFDNNVQTFGIGFEEKSFDESEFQDDISRFLNILYSNVKISNKEIGNLFSESIWHIEKPILRTAPVPMFKLAKLVHESGLKVVLTGEGADEVFGGYDIFKETKIRSFWAKRPGSAYRPLLLKNVYPYLSDNKKSQQLLFQFFRNGIDNPDNIYFSHLIRWENTSKLKTFFSKSVNKELKEYNCYDDLLQYIPGEFHKWDYLSKAQYLEIILFLDNYLLSSQGDRMAMAFSVETRLPYLDYRIMEMMSKAPASWKIHGMQEKYILKKALKNILPHNTLSRKKYPYRAPIVAGLLPNQQNSINGFKNCDFFNNTDLFDVSKIEKLFALLNNKSRPSELESMALAGIISTKCLYEEFLNGRIESKENIQLKKVFDKRGEPHHV